MTQQKEVLHAEMRDILENLMLALMPIAGLMFFLAACMALYAILALFAVFVIETVTDALYEYRERRNEHHEQEATGVRNSSDVKMN